MGKKAEKKAGFSVSLGFSERLLLRNILPQKGSIAVMRIVQDVIERIEVTSKEWKQVTPSEVEGGISWDLEKEPKPKSFDFEGFELEVVTRELRQLSDKEELTAAMITLYDKFVGE
jgi:hypothetical protein